MLGPGGGAGYPLAGGGEHLAHEVEPVQAAGLGLIQGLGEDLGGDAADAEEDYEWDVVTDETRADSRPPELPGRELGRAELVAGIVAAVQRGQFRLDNGEEAGPDLLGELRLCVGPDGGFRLGDGFS